MTIIKPLSSQATNNGAAYINTNSLKIVPPSGYITSFAQNENLFAVSGILQDRYQDVVSDINIVSVSGVVVSSNDIK